MPKLRRLYKLDQDGDFIGSTPLGPLSEPVWIEESCWYRVYLCSPSQGEPSYVDILSDSAKYPIFLHKFCEDATPLEIEEFEKKVKGIAFVDLATDRWGELTIQWAGPEAPKQHGRASTTLSIYFDDHMHFAFLDHRPQVIPTYQRLFEDFAILRESFESVREK